MRILTRPLGGSRLVRAYLDERKEAAPFYRGSPFDPETYRNKAEALDRVAQVGWRERSGHKIRPVGPRARVALREVIRANGYFVTTGQQPGLFGGPLYSLYKALTAVRLAEALEPVTGKPVMPLFWVASEDHDWEEANHVHVIDGGNELHRLTLGPEGGSGMRPLGEVRLGEKVGEVVGKMARLFPRNDFHARNVALLREAFHPGATLASGFSDLMAELLRDTPIGLVNAGDPALKEASIPLLRAEAEDSVAGETVLNETARALEDAGYALQVPLIPGAVNLFVHGEEGRDRLQRTDDGFRLRRSGRRLSRRQVFELINDHPGAVSPNVLLRPVVEGFLFPTLAYVGGPGELAYFGQLAGFFERHGVGSPVVFPRASLLVVEGKVEKVLEKFALAPDDLRDGDGLVNRFAREEVPKEVRRAVGRWKGAVGSHAGDMAMRVTEVDPTLKGAVAGARNSGLAALEALERKIVRAVKRQNEISWSQIGKAQVNLWPGGKPQDRMLSPLQYFMRYGDGFLDLAFRGVHLAPSIQRG